MRKLMNKIDRFCYKHPRFGIPNLMLYVVIGNVVIWLFSMMDRTGSLVNMLTFSPYYILRGQVWRLVTFALIPNTYSYLALIAFYFYYFIGSTVEREWGMAKFNIYFFTGIILTVIYGFIVYFTAHISMQISAYYIYMSMFFTFATLYPDMQVLLFFFIPIKMKWLGIVDAVYFLLMILQLPFPMNLLPVVAILNYFIFCGGWLIDLISPAKAHQRAQRRSSSMNFKNEVRRMQREQKSKPYTRRCSVCGRTDVSDPNLEFRYCSRCQGYHCFCMDHINSHIHFKE